MTKSTEFELKGIHIFAIFMFVIIIGGILTSFTIVPAGNKGIVFSKTQGVKDYTFNEGLNFKTPFIDEVVLIDIRTKKLERQISSTSQDQQTVAVKVAINYKPNSNQVNNLYQDIGLDYVEKVLIPAMEQSIKYAMAQYKAEDLLTNRDDVALEALENLRPKLKNSYVTIVSVNLVDIGFSAGFNSAIEAKVIAEQQEQKAINDLRRIEIEAKQITTKAQAEADAKLMSAEAEAKGILLQQESLDESEEVLQLRWIEKWNGQLPKISTGSSSPMLMNLNAETILGE